MRKLFPVLVSVAFVLLFVGFCVTTWKAFDLKDRIYACHKVNLKWEQELERLGAYGEGSVVFFGDSEMSRWPICPSFGSAPIRNRGVAGIGTSRALEQFRDVIALKPKAVVILIGINDLRKKVSRDGVVIRNPVPEITVGNIEKMVVSARDGGIDVILCSLLPTSKDLDQYYPRDKIRTANALLKTLAGKHGIRFVDLYTSMSDNEGYFRRDYTRDGIHPNKYGYACMTRMLSPVLYGALTITTLTPPVTADAVASDAGGG